MAKDDHMIAVQIVLFLVVSNLARKSGRANELIVELELLSNTIRAIRSGEAVPLSDEMLSRLEAVATPAMFEKLESQIDLMRKFIEVPDFPFAKA